MARLDDCRFFDAARFSAAAEKGEKTINNTLAAEAGENQEEQK
jgi:hypothetical protein